MSTEKGTYPGSCHCGKISYTIEFALPETPAATRCNCTICHKLGVAMLSLPEADFKLLKPASKDDDTVGDYVWRNKDCHRFFCKNCGTQVWSNGVFEYEGKKITFFNINALTLEPSEAIDLSKWKINYLNGATDGWFDGQGERPYPGGCV
jgi:hypothetical protein